MRSFPGGQKLSFDACPLVLAVTSVTDRRQRGAPQKRAACRTDKKQLAKPDLATSVLSAFVHICRDMFQARKLRYVHSFFIPLLNCCRLAFDIYAVDVRRGVLLIYFLTAAKIALSSYDVLILAWLLCQRCELGVASMACEIRRAGEEKVKADCDTNKNVLAR